MEEVNSACAVPKIIHYVWLGGKPKTALQEERIATWKNNCPDYQIIEWNEENFDVNCCDFIKEAVENRKFAFASDYVRLKALYEYGGIYLDMDVEVVKSFDDLLENDTVIGFENGANIAMGTIIVKPKQKWVKDMIDVYESSHFVRGRKFDDDPNSIKMTAYLKKRYGLKIDGKEQALGDGIMVVSRDYFCAKDFTTGKTEKTENTYAIHLYDSTWLPTDSFLYKFLRGVRKVVGRKGFDGLTRLYTKMKVRSLEKLY